MTARPDTGTGRDTRAHVAAGRHTTTATQTTRGDLMRDTYTADEVLTVATTSYLLGRYDADVNELHATWAEYREPRLTRELRVAARIAEMEAAATRQPWNTWRGQYPGGEVDFETGRLVRELRVAA